MRVESTRKHALVGKFYSLFQVVRRLRPSHDRPRARDQESDKDEGGSGENDQLSSESSSL